TTNTRLRSPAGRSSSDATGSTDKAIELGLARTGKLVTGGALILMFAFLVLSMSPATRSSPSPSASPPGSSRRHRDSCPARAGTDATARRRQPVDAHADAHASHSPPAA